MRIGAVGGLDPSGGAGIEMDVKVGSALDVYVHPVATMVTFQTASTYFGGRCLDVDNVIRQLETVRVNVWKLGALCSSEIADVVIDKISGIVVVDPVMRASAGGTLFDNPNKMKEVVKQAYAVTPNIPEAELLSGIEIETIDDMIKAARKIQELGPQLVVVSGGHAKELVDIIVYQDVVEVIKGRFRGPSAHGSGSVLATSLASYLAKGYDPVRAARMAVGFTRLLHAFKLKMDGGYVLDPFVQLRYLATKSEMYEEYYAFLQWLRELSIESAKRIAPEVGINVAYSVPTHLSRGKGSILAVPGRIHLTSKGLRPCSYPWWGASDHMARLLLAAQKYNPKLRAAMNIKYSKENIERLKEAGYEVVRIDRSEQPRGVKTMEWSITKAVELTGKVPDVIYDEGFYGKEAMIRLMAVDLATLKSMLESIIG